MIGDWLRGLQVDLRSLALLRATLGLCLLGDLLGRIPLLDAFYTDRGVLPRADFFRLSGRQPILSLNLMNGERLIQLLLVLFGIACALALILGYRSRLSAGLSWLLLTSFHARNPLIVTAGDDLLRMLLFWGMFVPLGGAASLDRALNPEALPPSPAHLSPGSLALVLQLCVVHWIAASTAAFVDLAGPAIAILWLAAPLIALSPVLTPTLRLGVVALMVSSYVWLGITADLGILPWVGSAAWTVMLPGWFWDRVGGRRTAADGVTIWIDGGCGFCRRMALILNRTLLGSTAPIREAQSDAGMTALMRDRGSWIVQSADGAVHQEYDGLVELSRHSRGWRLLAPVLRLPPLRWIGTRAYRWVAEHRSESFDALRSITPRPAPLKPGTAGQLVAVAAFLLMTVGQSAHADSGDRPKGPGARVLRSLSLGPSWADLATPVADGGWFQIDGATKAGSLFDLLAGGGPPSSESSGRRWQTLSDPSWDTYLRSLHSDRFAAHRPVFGDFLCRRWNAGRPVPQQVDLIWVYHNAPSPGLNAAEGPGAHELVMKHHCFEKPADWR